jgi:aminopeptidase N
VVYHEAVDGPEAAGAELSELRGRYTRARNAGNDTIVAQPNDQFPRGTYYPMVYGKAPLFVHALRQQLGDEAFFRFLQDYYASQRYELATGDALLAAAEASCGCALDEFYADWITRVAPVAIP